MAGVRRPDEAGKSTTIRKLRDLIAPKPRNIVVMSRPRPDELSPTGARPATGFTAHQLGTATGLALVGPARAAGRPMALHPRRCAEYG